MNYYDEISQSYDELHKEEQLNKLQIIFELDIIKPKDKLLDVGCGTGFSLDYFECKEAIGIDPSEKLIQQYKGSHKIICASAENLPFKNKEFDVVISITAIQNFDDIQKGLNEIKRVGKNKFALTFLKRSFKAQLIEDLIKKIFSEFKIERIEEEKDIIFIITK
jgi:ubiquinone/menaquinone biosynthesis C-methylase UbiE